MLSIRSAETRLLDAIFGKEPKLRIKVNTLNTDTLCRGCQHAQTIRGDNIQEVVYCHNLYPARRVPFPVKACDAYASKEAVDIHEMKEIAWVLKTDSGGRKIGFRPPKKDDKEDD